MADTQNETATERRKGSKYLGSVQKIVPTAPLPMKMPMQEVKELLEALRAEVKAGRGRDHRGEEGIMAEFVFIPGNGNGNPDHIQIVASYG
jgi:hypothetical protein